MLVIHCNMPLWKSLVCLDVKVFALCRSGGHEIMVRCIKLIAVQFSFATP